jgi:hypothetical protein
MFKKVLFAISFLVCARSASAWSVYLSDNAGSYKTVTNSQSFEATALNAVGLTAPIQAILVGPGVTIDPATPANSWVQYEFNVSLTSGTRCLIVFRNPQNSQIAAQLDQFQKAIASGRKLIFIRNQSREGYSLNNGWEDFLGTQTSFDILPGDLVTFYFR